MKIYAIVQARTTSTRLPGKVLEEIEGKPMVWHVMNRVLAAETVDKAVLAFPDTKENDMIQMLAEKHLWEYARGSEDDVLARYVSALTLFPCDHVVRITADCPLADPAIIDLVVKEHLESSADYTSNTLKRDFPRGLDVEVFRVVVLEQAHREAKQPYAREHVTPYIYEHPEVFLLRSVEAPKALKRPDLRLTVDTKEDLELVRAIYGNLYEPGKIFGLQEVIALFHQYPDLKDINAAVKQKTLGD